MIVFGVTTLLNVPAFLPTAFWITATYSLLFATATRTNQYLRHNSCHVEIRLNGHN